MVDTGLLTTGLVVTLAGIALVVVGGLAYIVYEAVERRLDARAGVPPPGEEEPSATRQHDLARARHAGSGARRQRAS